MAQKLQQQLRDVGSKLQDPPPSKDALIKLLRQAANCLSEIEQSPLPSMLDSMKPCVNAIANQELLKHKDRDVKVLVASCICEITRITAPEAPFSDDILRDIFHLIIHTFSGLSDINSPSFGRRVVILETLARYKSCVVMLDLECDDLINEMFSTFFSVISDDHPNTVLTSMQKIMILILEESEDIQDNLLSTILSPLGRKKTDFSQSARKLAMDVIKHCSGILEPFIKQFLVSSLSGDRTSLNNSVDYHEVIYDVYRCAQKILYGVVAYITGELLSDKLDIRMKAVQLLGELFALPGFSLSEPFQPLFSEFLKRLTDRVIEVRVSVIEHLRNCVNSNPSRVEAPSIIKALSDRLLDYNEDVRKQVVAAIYDMTCHSSKAIPVETLRLVADRLRDKTFTVRKYTMERLADIYRLNCLRSTDCSTTVDELEWIPGKILRCLYGKEFRSEMIELILCGSLFPPELSINARLKHWAAIFLRFDKVELKALKLLLFQKQRLQQQMKKFLSLRQTHQEGNSSELQKLSSVCCQNMVCLFSDSNKAEEGFQLLNQLKDVNIWKMLTTLLNPCTSLNQAWSCRDGLLKTLGEEHPLYDFMGVLSTKCSYFLFDKECVKEILVYASTNPEDVEFISSCMKLLAIITCFSPQLLVGFEENLVNLLKDGNEIIKEHIAHVLATAGGTIRELLSKMTSSADLLLERLCVEGTRKQAKYSVQALVATSKNDGLKSLSVLYERLVDMLEETAHLPAVLQSLGCIARIAMSIYETREGEIFRFIKHKVLECNNTEGSTPNKAELNEKSEHCLLKIFGIKVLVKSFLPLRDAHMRSGIESVVDILKNILSFGEISQNIESSLIDKAHMRLASAKSVIRLSRQWEHKIPLDVFYLTLRVSEDIYVQTGKVFNGKVQQYIKERLLDAKYACALLFSVKQFRSLEYKEGKNNLLEIMQLCRQHKVLQLSMQNNGNSTIAYPEYILVYLVHALAHQPSSPSIDECNDGKAFEPIYWRLHLFLSVYLHGDGIGKSEGETNLRTNYSKIVSIFHNIKFSEDAVDDTKSKISHAICDLGLSIAKRLVNDELDVSGMATSLILPSTLYKPADNKEGEQPVTWLSDESTLAHFEALMSEDKEPSALEAAKDKMDLEDVNIEEVPLGKMIKFLKSHGAKKNKSLKRHASPLDKRELGKEIYLDNMKSEHSMQIGELTKDNELSEIRQTSMGNSNEEVSVSEKRNEYNGIARLAMRIPNSKKPESKSRVLLKSHSKKLNALNNDSDESKTGGAVINDLVVEASNLSGTAQKIDNLRSSKSAPKKRKISTGLARCSTHDILFNKEELIGSRIKVWWPMDKAFYEGLVQSYDPVKNKHQILYDDGDEEILNLDKQKWEHIFNIEMPKTKPKSPLPSCKETSLGKNKKIISSNSRQKMSSPNRIRRKSGSKRHAELNSKTLKNEGHEGDVEGYGNPEMLCSHSHSGSEVNDVSSDAKHGARNEESTPLEKEEKILPISSLQEEDQVSVNSHSDKDFDSDSDNEPLGKWRLPAGKIV